MPKYFVTVYTECGVDADSEEDACKIARGRLEAQGYQAALSEMAADEIGRSDMPKYLVTAHVSCDVDAASEQEAARTVQGHLETLGYYARGTASCRKHMPE
jgi:hypothetical protein